MIYGILLGISLRLSGLPFGAAAGIIPTAFLLKAAYEILVRRGLVTGAESGYHAYVANLRATGSPPARPWLSYGIQMVLWGSLLGYAAFAITSLFA